MSTNTVILLAAMGLGAYYFMSQKRPTVVDFRLPTEMPVDWQVAREPVKELPADHPFARPAGSPPPPFSFGPVPKPLFASANY